VFTVIECNQLVNEFDLSEFKNIEHNENYYFNSVGVYNLPGTLNYVPQLTQLVCNYCTDIKFSNTYTRRYQEGSFLGIHTDRPGLDITLGVCLKDNNVDWPLHISNLEYHGPWQTGNDYSNWIQDCTSYSTKIGQGLLCQGIKYPHWRDHFPGNAGEYAMYVFYHWTIII
jgi:hypothetical protein